MVSGSLIAGVGFLQSNEFFKVHKLTRTSQGLLTSVKRNMLTCFCWFRLVCERKQGVSSGPSNPVGDLGFGSYSCSILEHFTFGALGWLSIRLANVFARERKAQQKCWGASERRGGGRQT